MNQTKTATWVTLGLGALSLTCVFITGYLFVRQTMLGDAPDNIHWSVIRQRSALLALVATTALGMIVLGFATFFAGVRGEFKVDAESQWVKGAVSSGAPGIFFVLCGTIILGQVTTSKMLHESGDGTTSAIPAGPVQSDKPEKPVFSPIRTTAEAEMLEKMGPQRR